MPRRPRSPPGSPPAPTSAPCARPAGSARSRPRSAPAAGRASPSAPAGPADPTQAVDQTGPADPTQAVGLTETVSPAGRRRNPLVPRSHASDQPLHPLVVRPERVLAQDRPLGLVVELQVHPVHSEVT